MGPQGSRGVLFVCKSSFCSFPDSSSPQGGVFCPIPGTWLSHVTCFGQWNVSITAQVSVLSSGLNGALHVSACPSITSAISPGEDCAPQSAGSRARAKWSRQEPCLRPRAESAADHEQENSTFIVAIQGGRGSFVKLHYYKIAVCCTPGGSEEKSEGKGKANFLLTFTASTSHGPGT